MSHNSNNIELPKMSIERLEKEFEDAISVRKLFFQQIEKYEIIDNSILNFSELLIQILKQFSV